MCSVEGVAPVSSVSRMLIADWSISATLSDRSSLSLVADLVPYKNCKKYFLEDLINSLKIVKNYL